MSSAGKSKRTRQKNKRQTLDAYATAAKAVPEARPRGHRLGEVEDEPKSKRRRIDTDQEDTPHDIEKEQRRRKRKQNSGDTDDVEYGSDSSGNEWVLGGIADDDDDSDIDSDEAFGESDEERFAGFTFRGSSSGKKKHGVGKSRQVSGRGSVDLGESSEDEDDSGDDSEDDVGLGLGEDAVDLATMLDDDPNEDVDNTRNGPHDSGEDSEDETDDSENSDGFQSATDSDVDEDDDDPLDEERIARMQDRLDAMDSSSANKKPARIGREFAPATLDDFLEDTDLQKSFQKASKSKKQANDATAIAAPLPRRQQARIDRETATAKANEQLERWKDTVVKNRRAEHLTFPLQNAPADLATVGKERFAPVSQETPRTGLEETIRQIMQESGLAEAPTSGTHEAREEESALLKSEELGTNKLPIEEVMRRRAELRKARHLLFREEIKAKRIAKIKSKSYRKVHRKERQRLEAEERQAIEELGLDDMAGESQQDKADRARAEARVATKHKDSKWAKALKATNRAAWDESARDGVFEQARRTEELRRRIAGKENLDDDSLSSSAEYSGDENDAEDNQLTSLSRLDKSTDGESLKGLSALKFMRAADERQRKANEEDLRRLRREIAEENGHELDSDENDEDRGEGLGRAIYGPQSNETATQAPKEERLDFEAPDDTDSENDGSLPPTIKSETAPHSKQVHGKLKSALRETKGASGTSTNAHVGSGDKSAISWLQAPRTKSKHGAGSSDDVVLQTGLRASSEVDTKTTNGKPARLPAAKLSAIGDLDSTRREAAMVASLIADDADNDESDLLTGVKSLKQRAFAGDDVHIAFNSEKDEVIASEDEKETSSYLPGWGSWAGEGLSKREKKANSRAKHNPLFKSKTAGVKRADRKDANLKNVIISEKNERKGRKYLAPQLPHEFESQEQYERSRRLPMGPEWTTKEVHQKQTRPRVVIKPGVIIDALERPIV